MSELPWLEDLVELGEELGRGSFGAVLRGRLHTSGEEVAVKLAHPGGLSDELPRVIREARLLRDLEHPSLARFLGLLRSRQSGSLALVYERIRGEDLTALRGQGPPSREESAGWLRDLARGVDALHGAGLLHRDIKPGNVIIEPSGRARLLDFGLARPVGTGSTLTASGVILGTPQYLAPWVLRGDPPDPAADRHALGVLAWWLLTGSVPFPGPSPAAILAAQEGEPPAPRGVGPEVARVLVSLVGPRSREPSRSAGKDIERLLAALDAKADSPPAATTRVLPRGHSEEENRTHPLAGPTAPEGSQGSRVPMILLGLFLVGVLGTGGILSRPASSTHSNPPTLPASLTEPANPTESAPGPGPGASGVLPSPELPLSPQGLQAMRQRFGDLSGYWLDPAGHPLPEGSARSPGAWEVGDGDPAHWYRVRRIFPEISRFRLWAGRGGNPWELPTALREELERTDRYFLGAGLPPPFRATLAPPGSGDRAPSPRLRAFFREHAANLARALPPRVRDWEGTCLEAMDQCLARLEERDRLLRAQSPELPPEIGSLGSNLITLLDVSLKRLLIHAYPGGSQRALCYRWVSPEITLLERVLFSAGRALAEPGEDHRLLAALLQTFVDQVSPHLLRSHLHQIPLEELLGPADQAPPARSLVDERIHTASQRAIALHGVREAPLPGDLEAILARMARIPVETRDPAGYHLHANGVKDRARRALERGDCEEVRDLTRPFLGLDPAAPEAPGILMGVLRHLAAAVLREESSLSLSRPELRRLLELMEGGREEHPVLHDRHWELLREEIYEERFGGATGTGPRRSVEQIRQLLRELAEGD